MSTTSGAMATTIGLPFLNWLLGIVHTAFSISTSSQRIEHTFARRGTGVKSDKNEIARLASRCRDFSALKNRGTSSGCKNRSRGGSLANFVIPRAGFVLTPADLGTLDEHVTDEFNGIIRRVVADARTDVGVDLFYIFSRQFGQPLPAQMFEVL